MNKLSAKNKIYLLVVVWVALSGLMYSYFFKIFEAKNRQLAWEITKKYQEQFVLEAEQQSFRQAQQDLAKLSEQPVHPQDFFSRDVTLVNEIKELEGMADSYGVELIIRNLSGTVKTATKAKSVGDMAYVSASLVVRGSLVGIVSFMEDLENARFIANVTSLGLASGDSGVVTATLETQFYLKRK